MFNQQKGAFFIECLACGAKYYYWEGSSNAHDCPNCEISHEDMSNCKTIGFRKKRLPLKYIYPSYQDPKTGMTTRKWKNYK